MANRFTDTEKWKKPFIKNLKGPLKLLWFYICDDCDHAGIWHVDLEVAEIRTGEKVSLEDAIKNFGEKIVIFDGGEKWFIPSFIEFQYPSGLQENNKAHAGIIKKLQKYGLIDENLKPLAENLKGLPSPFKGDMDNDKELGIGNGLKEGGVGETKSFTEISELEIGQAIQYVKVTGQVDWSPDEVKEKWGAFVIHTQNEPKTTRNDYQQYFRNWLKKQKKQNGQQANTNGAHHNGQQKLGTSAARIARAKEW